MAVVWGKTVQDSDEGRLFSFDTKNWLLENFCISTVFMTTKKYWTNPIIVVSQKVINCCSNKCNVSFYKCSFLNLSSL